MKAKAWGVYLFIQRDDEATSMSGLDIPDAAKKKPNTGKILSAGKLVGEHTKLPGKKALFSKAIGDEYIIEGETVTVIREDQLLGVE